MRVSVVIPTYQRRDLLGRTLDRLLAQEYDDYEVIVAVDGSTDGTAEMLSSLSDGRLVAIVGPNRGPAAARNRALEVVTGDLVLFLDDDILCRPDLLRVHAAAHADGVARLVFGPILVAEESPNTLATAWTRAHSLAYIARLEREGALRAELDAYVDPNSSVPLAALRAVGGFDESLVRQCETADLGLRLWKAGLPFVYEPRAVVRHVFDKTARDLIDVDAVWSGRNELTLARKHPELRARSPLALVGEGSLARRVARRALVGCGGLADAALARPMALAERVGATRTGIGLLRARQGIAVYRSAAQALGGWPALHRRFGLRLPTLVYHYVGPPRADLAPSLCVTPARLRRHLSWLAALGFVGIRATDWLAWVRGEAPLPRRPVLLTFDDAFAATADHALPLLRERGWGATVFAVSRLRVNSWDGGTVPLMDAAALRHWAGQGIEVGAHGRTHRALVGLPTAELAAELAGSRDDLADLIGAPVTSFAYPFGGVDANAARAAFAIAFGAAPGTAYLGSDPHDLPRSMVLPTDGALDLFARATLGWSPLQRLRHALGAAIRR